MSRFSASSFVRTGWEVLTSPRRFHATLNGEEGIGRAVLYYFVCAAVASALDLFGIGALQGAPAAVRAIPMTLVRLGLSMGVVPFILGGILYGVCWIAGSKAEIESGVHITSYSIGTVVPMAMVLSYHPTHGLQSAAAALGWGLILVMVYARMSWGGRQGATASVGGDAGAAAAAASAPQA